MDELTELERETIIVQCVEFAAHAAHTGEEPDNSTCLGCKAKRVRDHCLCRLGGLVHEAQKSNEANAKEE